PVPVVGLFALHPTNPVAIFADKRDVLLWDLENNREMERRLVGSYSLAFDWSPDGESLAVAAREGVVLVFNSRSERVFARYAHPIAPVHLEWHPDGQRLLTSTVHGHTQIWRIDGGTLPQVEMFANAGIGFTQGGSHLVTIAEGTLSLRPLEEPAPVYTMLSGPVGVSAFEQMCFSPDGRSMVSLSSRHGVYVWERASVRGITLPETRGRSRSWLAFAPDAKSLFTLGSDGVERWPFDYAGALPRLGKPSVLPESVPMKSGGTAALSADGTRLLYTSRSDLVVLLDLAGRAPVRPFDVPIDVGAIVWRPDGHQFALTGPGSHSATLLYDAATCQLAKRFETGEASVAWSPDGRWLAQMNATACELFDAATLARVAVFPREFAGPLLESNAKSIPCRVAFSPDGSMLAFLSAPERIALIDIKARAIPATITLPDRATAQGLLWSADGAVLLAHNTLHSHLYNIREMRAAILKLGLDW
ncbi:MAG: hypothetical protein V4710_22925, partial [Verrucomicrobiota bacterium]